MPRTKCRRHIETQPNVTYYKPAGISLRELTEVTLELDELETIRLADLQGLYQNEAAEQMKISRQTFGRIITSAHQKIAEALIHGKSIKINTQTSKNNEDNSNTD